MGTIVQNYQKPNEEKTKDVLDYLVRYAEMKIRKRQIWNEYYETYVVVVDYQGVRVCEMHEKDGECHSTKDDYYGNRYDFSKFWNTRYLAWHECRIEFEYENLQDNLRAIYDTCLNLIKGFIHFCVFYAIGQKSPHIIIYDLLPFNDLTLKNSVELTDTQRRAMRLLFCSQMVPIEHHYYLDKALLSNHKVCLEFAPHWKYDTPFELLFEHVPEEKNGTD